MNQLRKAMQIALDKGYRVSVEGVLIGVKGTPLAVKRRGSQRYPTFSVAVGNLTPSGVFGIPAHKFAAYVFYGDAVFEEGIVVRHLNADTEDISRGNIVLGTYSDNERDKAPETRRKAAQTARAAQGSRPSNARFSDYEVWDIRYRLDNGESQAGIAREYGVTRQAIHRIAKGLNY